MTFKGMLKKITITLWLIPVVSQASFIETTIGTAVVNDATASYFNPAALMLLKNSQIIPQVTFASFHTQFSGQSTSKITNTTESGHSHSTTNYSSPSFFLGIPTHHKLILGLAVVSNEAVRSTDENSILRYVQANNDIQDYDIVPALAIKINDQFSIGGGINFSHTFFDLKPIIQFPGSNIADSQSDNKSNGRGIGGNAGFLLKPNAKLLIGFNYRSITTYRLNGKSIFEGPPQVISNHYHFKLSTPARAVASMNYFFTEKLGLITTIQRIKWSNLKNLHIYQIAGLLGNKPALLNGIIAYYLKDSWLITLGTHYHFTPQCVLRIAGTYNESPGNPHYQITTGDSMILGTSIGYEINKYITVDGSYAHAWMKNENINLNGNRFSTQGINKGSRDSISLKLTLNEYF